MSVRLFVGNLPYQATERELREHFSAAGPVAYLSLPTDRETGQPRGFAFVEFNDRSQAENAIRQFNNQPFQGRPIAVSEARPREDRPQGSGSSRAYVPRPSSQPGQSAADQDGPNVARPETLGNKRSRNFGPDASPHSRRKGQGARPERAPKGPMREMVRGQFFGDDEGEDDSYDDDADNNLIDSDGDLDEQDSNKENVDGSEGTWNTIVTR